MTIRISDTLLAGIQAVIGIVVIALAVTAGYQNYQGDKCSEAFKALAATNQTRINQVQARLDAVRVREAALQLRMKAQSAPGSDTK